MTAAEGSGWTLVLAPGTYRETVAVDISRTEATWIGASEDPRDVVIVYDNAAGTSKPGGGTYGTTGSATTTVQADGFTARWITFANDWLRADHPDITGTQAVAIKVQETGARSPTAASSATRTRCTPTRSRSAPSPASTTRTAMSRATSSSAGRPRSTSSATSAP